MEFIWILINIFKNNLWDNLENLSMDWVLVIWSVIRAWWMCYCPGPNQLEMPSGKFTVERIYICFILTFPYFLFIHIHHIYKHWFPQNSTRQPFNRATLSLLKVISVRMNTIPISLRERNWVELVKIHNILL